MFWITEDPSTRSLIQRLAKITKMVLSCPLTWTWSVLWQRILTHCACVQFTVQEGTSYTAQTSRSLKLRYQEHILYIKNNNPQSAYGLHILQNHHEYGPMNQTMHLLNPINITSSLIPYKRLYIQSFHQGRKLIPEQRPGDPNPVFQPVIDPHHPQLDKTSCMATSTPHTRPTQRLSRPPLIQKLGYVKLIYKQH